MNRITTRPRKSVAAGTSFLATTIIIFSIILPVQHANAIIDISGDVTIPKETTKQLKLVVKLFKTISKLESKGELNGTTVSVPVTLIIPINVKGQNAQICVALLSSGNMTCRQIVVNNNQVSFAANATLLSEDAIPSGSTGDATEELKFAIKLLKKVAKGDSNITSITIPITFIIPIDIDSETSQICLSILSSGELNCQQIIINESNQTASMASVAENGTLEASAADNSTAAYDNSTAQEMDDNNATSDSDIESDESCVTPCPPEQYCIQMCQPMENTTADG